MTDATTPSADNWALTTVLLPSGEYSAVVRLADGTLVRPEILSQYSGAKEVLENWDEAEQLLRTMDLSAARRIEAEETLSVRLPNKLICAGANYHGHLAEMGAPTVPEGITPFFFILPPSTTMIGDGGTILIPEDESAAADWEAELAVVIGRGGRDIAEENALDHVAGYACFNDVTARGWFRRAAVIGPPFAWDWMRSKGQDTCSPMGAVTPHWQVGDPSSLTVQCLVNGTLKQDAPTSDMIFNVPRLIADASRIWALEPGDVIATGTPAGVGNARGEQLKAGDAVEVNITGLSPLRNRVAVRR